jgi:hypothetical protein
MAVNHLMTAAPRQPWLPDGDRFAALLADLFELHVATLPAYLLTGRVDEEVGAYDLGTELRGSLEEGTTRSGRGYALAAYRGSDLGQFLAAARIAPLGSEDVCVYFVSRFWPPSAGNQPEAGRAQDRCT